MRLRAVLSTASSYVLPSESIHQERQAMLFEGSIYLHAYACLCEWYRVDRLGFQGFDMRTNTILRFLLWECGTQLCPPPLFSARCGGVCIRVGSELSVTAVALCTTNRGVDVDGVNRRRCDDSRFGKHPRFFFKAGPVVPRCNVSHPHAREHVRGAYAGGRSTLHLHATTQG